MKPRYSVRKVTTCKVTLSCGPRVGEGTVTDLTVPGCQLHTAFPLEASQSIQLHLHFDQQRPMRVDLGVVRWASHGKAGIEFIRMAETDQLRLRFYVGFAGRRAPASRGWSEKPMCVDF